MTTQNAVDVSLSGQTGTGNFVGSISPTFAGTVTYPTPFTLGAVSVTTTGTQLNYLAAITATNNSLVYSTASAFALLAPVNSASLASTSAGAIQWLAMTDGQLIIGSTAGQPAAGTLTAGTGISITNAGNSITIAVTGGGDTWSTVTGTSQAAVVNSGYFTNNAGLVTVTLPATAAVGSIVEVAGQGAGGWKLAANSGQTIQYGNLATTTAGSFASTNQFDTIRVVCQVANTTWQVLSSISAGLTRA